MLESLITSGTRIKLLLKFFINPNTRGYLRQLAAEFNESTNSIRLELNKLSEAQILLVSAEGRNKIYRANTNHPLYEDLRNIVLKSTGIDRVVSNILNKLGNIRLAFIRGDYASGKDNGLIDLVIVGDQVNQNEIERIRSKTENLINRKLSVLVLNEQEYEKLKARFLKEPYLMLFTDPSALSDAKDMD
jgi:hypothetical protein